MRYKYKVLKLYFQQMVPRVTHPRSTEYKIITIGSHLLSGCCRNPNYIRPLLGYVLHALATFTKKERSGLRNNHKL